MADEEKSSAPVVSSFVVVGQPIAQVSQAASINMSRYRVTVPHGVYSGDMLTVNIGGRLSTVKVPPNTYSGSTFLVLIDGRGNCFPEAPPVIGYDVGPINPQLQIIPRVDLVFCMFWGILELLITCLLISACTVPVYAQQNISTGCNARNPSTGTVVNRMYYLLYIGLCSNPNGKDTGGNFCIMWKDDNAWQFIDSIIGSNLSSAADIGWQAVQVMIPLAVAFAVFSAASSYTAMTQDRNANGNAQNLIFISLSSTMLIVCWLFATSSLSTSLSTQIMNSSVWTRLYVSGTSFSEVLAGRTTNTTVQLSTTPCFVSIEFGNDLGLLFLSIASPMAFIVSWIILCTRCLGGGLEERNNNNSQFGINAASGYPVYE